MMQGFFHRAQDDRSGSRSTALQPLQWALGLLLASLPPMLWAKAPSWLIITISVAIVSVLVAFLFAYLFLLNRNVDALRSEAFSLTKMRIEKGLVGDDATGLRHLFSDGKPAQRPLLSVADDQQAQQ